MVVWVGPRAVRVTHTRRTVPRHAWHRLPAPEPAERAAREDAELVRHANHIEDEIMTLKCPAVGCGQAFLDFDGCYALRCSRCATNFCGYCLLDHGEGIEADRACHAHVAQCPERYGATHCFGGPISAFNEAQRIRKRKALTAYLHTIPAPLKDRVKARCRAAIDEVFPGALLVE